jgi:hypothetical protein
MFDPYIKKIYVRPRQSTIKLNAQCLMEIPCTIKNSVALARKRTIPTERPPLVGGVSAKFPVPYLIEIC